MTLQKTKMMIEKMRWKMEIMMTFWTFKMMIWEDKIEDWNIPIRFSGADRNRRERWLEGL